MKTKLIAASSGFVLLLLIFFMAGCQQEDQVTPGSQLINRAPPECTPLNRSTGWTLGTICLGEEVSFNYTSDATCGAIQIQTFTPGDADYEQVVHVMNTSNGDVTYTFTPDVLGVYLIRFKYTSSGGGCTFCQDNGFVQGVVLVVQECGCEIDGNTFTGTADPSSCDGTRGATYELCSEDGLDYFKIQGGLTNFTGADAIVTIVGGTGITYSQHTPGMSTNRIITVEGGLDECSCVTVHVTWNSSNTGGTITGEWSAKNGDGLIPGTAYTAELDCIE